MIYLFIYFILNVIIAFVELIFEHKVMKWGSFITIILTGTFLYFAYALISIKRFAKHGS
jgi:hypothetical protein